MRAQTLFRNPLQVISVFGAHVKDFCVGINVHCLNIKLCLALVGANTFELGATTSDSVQCIRWNSSHSHPAEATMAALITDFRGRPPTATSGLPCLVSYNVLM